MKIFEQNTNFPSNPQPFQMNPEVLFLKSLNPYKNSQNYSQMNPQFEYPQRESHYVLTISRQNDTIIVLFQ